MANRHPSKQGEPGGAGNQHNDWGHSEVGGNRQSATRLDDVVGSATGHPAEEAGERQPGMGWVESLSSGQAGSRQSESARQGNKQ